MRLDKFLKVSRIIKRRIIAKEIADQGRVTINERVAKSSTDVSVGDQLQITFGHKILKINVTALLETTKKEDAGKMYDIISEETK